MKEENEEFSEDFDDQTGKSEEDELDITSEIENMRPKELEVKEVKVVGVYEHHEQGITPPGLSPPAFVLLRDNQGRQVLIWIGHAEAFAISLALEDKTSDRPITHDLLKNFADRVGCQIERILIDDLWQGTYYAKLVVNFNDNMLEIDSRPSDAIALALRAKAPIFMAEYVLEAASITEET